jgi:ribonucleoside-diphosphate reductase alpha chain
MTNISDNALDLLQKRYFKKEYDEKTWEDICNRVSTAIADAEDTVELKEKWAKEFYDLMDSMQFIPSTPVLLNSDINNPGQLSSCFIIDIQDNIESIYQAKAECAKIFQKNGGVGFNISALRPKNATVETSKGYSCGVVGFMEEFNLTADVVTRNNIRKGGFRSIYQ